METKIKEMIEKVYKDLNLAICGMWLIAAGTILFLFYEMIIGAFFDGLWMAGIVFYIICFIFGILFWIIGYIKSKRTMRSDEWKEIELCERDVLENTAYAAAVSSVGLNAAGRITHNEVIKGASYIAGGAAIGLTILSLYHTKKRIKKLAENLNIDAKDNKVFSRSVLIIVFAAMTVSFILALVGQIRYLNEVKDLQQEKADILGEYLTRSYAGSYGNKVYGYLDDDNYVVITLDDEGNATQVAYMILPEEGTFEYMCAEVNDILDDFSDAVYAAAGEEFHTDNAKITNSVCEALQEEDYYIIYDGGYRYYYSYEDDFYISVEKE